MMKTEKDNKTQTMIQNNCYCCKETEVELWDICDICGWQNQMNHNENPTLSGGANVLSLNDYRAKWIESQKEKHSV